MSRAPLVEVSNSIATLETMTKAATKIDDQQAAEARRLAELYRERSGGMTQEEFGSKYNIGTQGMMWQLLNGRRPLSLKSAVGFARGLNVPLDEVSPTIAAEVKEAAQFVPDLAFTHEDGSVTLVQYKRHEKRNPDEERAQLQRYAEALKDKYPLYVLDAQNAVAEAYEANAPREVFDAVRILLSQHLKHSESGTIASRQKKDETVKKPAASMQSIAADADRAIRDAESRLATRDEEQRAARKTGVRRSKGVRH